MEIKKRARLVFFVIIMVICILVVMHYAQRSIEAVDARMPHIGYDKQHEGVSRNAGLLISVKALYAHRAPQSPQGEVHPLLGFDASGGSPYRGSGGSGGNL